ncbi:hypothetical protein DP113_09050 [Brasilonema octagenarum UFV-E1]|uniref:Uncharacterized protein n=1 Tax=Brasilonema sennae CENA114 TaxID=415709 RepID=A0A856MCJ1_9CYAN|nr:hypothetical protein DP114_09095 [Brasilonema sennae CENA114]QDL14399.1 hypothetical protein DP113_09050 [Brasilonema octagenarum UFV-E1]
MPPQPIEYNALILHQGKRQILQRGGSFSGEASPENVPWEPPAVATTVKARRLGCFPRQTLGEPQRQVPLSGNPHQGLAPSGNARRLRRETRLQRWIHRKALLWATDWLPSRSTGDRIDGGVLNPKTSVR